MRHADEDRAGGRNTMTRDADVDLCETDEQKERRLIRQAQEVCLGNITHQDIPAKTAQFARVEVTYQVTAEEREEAGFFRVYFPVELDPYDAARELVETEAEKRWGSNPWYFSVDDILSR